MGTDPPVRAFLWAMSIGAQTAAPVPLVIPAVDTYEHGHRDVHDQVSHKGRV